jgi:hypothetical protein
LPPTVVYVLQPSRVGRSVAPVHPPVEPRVRV